MFQAPPTAPPPGEEAGASWGEFHATDIFRFHNCPQPQRIGLFPLQALPIGVCTQGRPWADRVLMGLSNC